MLDRVDERSINLHFDPLRRYSSGGSHHRDCGGGGCFRPFFIYCDKCFVKDLRNIKVIVRFTRRDFIKVRAAGWLIEGGFHSQSLQRLAQRYSRWFEFEFGQREIDVVLFQLGSLRQHLRVEF